LLLLGTIRTAIVIGANPAVLGSNYNR